MNLYDYKGDVIMTTFSTPEDYGAAGDGTVDDTNAIQQALNDGGYIVFYPQKTYKVTGTLRVYANTIIDLNGSTIISTTKHLMYNFLSSDTFTGYAGNGNITVKNGTIIGGSISFAHGEMLELKGILFKNSLNDHFLEIAGCKDYAIKDCAFIGMENLTTSVLEYINIDPCIYGCLPWLPEGSAFYDGTINNELKIEGCYFDIGSDDYAYGFNAVGVHSTGGTTTKHKDIRIINNDIRNFSGCGLRLNHMQEVYVADNRIETVGDGIRIGDVAAVTDIVIKGNYVVSSEGEKILKTSGQYSNLTIANNVTMGYTQDF